MAGLPVSEKGVAGSNVTSRPREGSTAQLPLFMVSSFMQARSRSSSGTGRRGQEVRRTWKCPSAGFYFYLVKPAESERGRN